VRTISVALVDEDRHFLSAGTKVVTVQNVAPVLTTLSVDRANVVENDLVTINGEFTDPGGEDSHIFFYLLGTTEVQPRYSGGCERQVFSSPIATLMIIRPEPPAIVTPSPVRVNDGVSDSSTVTTNVTVSNGPPALNVSAASSVQEGSLFNLSGIVSDVGSLDTAYRFRQLGRCFGHSIVRAASQPAVQAPITYILCPAITR